MARGVNKAIILGNLGQDPEVRYTSSGAAVANISVATSEAWKDKQTGEKQERTEWHRVVFFGKLAEVVGQYLRKGSKVYIEGRIQTEKYQAKDGADRYSTKIVGNDMQMLDGQGVGQRSQPQGGGQSSGGAPAPSNEPADDFDDTDIPF